MRKVLSLIVFGPPGIGKGTLGALLCSATGSFHCSSGDIFRNLDPNSELGKLCNKYTAMGHLVPDDLTVDIWASFVQKLIKDKNYDPNSQIMLLDGIPRTVAQKEALDKHINVVAVLRLDAPRNVIIERLKNRGEKENRVDDTEDIWNHRLDIYTRETERILDLYDESVICNINANQSIQEVLQEALGSLLSVTMKRVRKTF